MTSDNSVFLLLGPEEGEKEKFIKNLKNKLSGEGNEIGEVHRFYGFDAKIADIISILQNETLFSENRLVILSNTELITRKEDINLITEYCSNPASKASFLLLSETIKGVNSRIERAVPKDNRKIFWELFENQKRGWIVNFFRRQGMNISSSACNDLLEIVENNTKQLRLECERLVLFFGKGAKIESEAIEKYIYHSKEENVFTLFDKVAQRKLDIALEVLHNLLLSREREALQILNGLLSQFRKLAALKGLIAGNYTLSEAFSRLRIKSKRVQKIYIESDKNYQAAEIKTIIMLIAEFEVRLRSVKSNLQAFLLNLFLYYVIVRGGKGAWRGAPG
jgi:DNA polymerase-3 subunit delta